MESTGLLRAIIIVGDTARWTQQDLASLVQISASNFDCYKVVVVADETIWSWPSSFVAWRQTRII